MKRTVYIHPCALTDVSGGCNIYAKDGVDERRQVRDDYEQDPKSWLHVGYMKSSGRIRDLDKDAVGEELYRDLTEDGPLMAGVYYRAEIEPKQQLAPNASPERAASQDVAAPTRKMKM